jgi:hypothetical protein
MDDLSAPRIDPLAQDTSLDKRSPPKEPARKREISKKPLPSPDIESGDSVEDIHQIDELA